MKTALLLMAQYESPTIPLSDVCEYLGLGEKEAASKARLNKLPFPTFRLTTSQKSPLLVHIHDLATFIDGQRDAARKEWEKSQV